MRCFRPSCPPPDDGSVFCALPHAPLIRFIDFHDSHARSSSISLNFHISTRAPRLFHRIFITTPRASVDFIEFALLLRAPLVDFIIHTPTHAPRLFHRSFTTPPRAPPSVTQNLISAAWWLIVNFLTPEQRGVFCRTLQVDPQGGHKKKQKSARRRFTPGQRHVSRLWTTPPLAQNRFSIKLILNIDQLSALSCRCLSRSERSLNAF